MIKVDNRVCHCLSLKILPLTTIKSPLSQKKILEMISISSIHKWYLSGKQKTWKEKKAIKVLIQFQVHQMWSIKLCLQS